MARTRWDRRPLTLRLDLWRLINVSVAAIRPRAAVQNAKAKVGRRCIPAAYRDEAPTWAQHVPMVHGALSPTDSRVFMCLSLSLTWDSFLRETPASSAQFARHDAVQLLPLRSSDSMTLAIGAAIATSTEGTLKLRSWSGMAAHQWRFAISMSLSERSKRSEHRPHGKKVSARAPSGLSAPVPSDPATWPPTQHRAACG